MLFLPTYRLPQTYVLQIHARNNNTIAFMVLLNGNISIAIGFRVFTVKHVDEWGTDANLPE